MTKIIAAINMTVDGFCDHMDMVVDDEVHQHYTDLIRSGGTMLYGSITYQMMESYWPTLIKNPSGNKSNDEFAVAIEDIHKIVYSHTLQNVTWKNSTLKKEINNEEILKMKQQASKDILVGSRSLIVSLLNLSLIDEFQLCIHPVILGNGQFPLLKNISQKISLKLLKTKTFGGGVVIFYYQPISVS